MSNRTVTVFVTVYNIEQYLERFFECLKKQTYTDYEALIIDDGSTDNSLAVCRQYAQNDDRIRVLSVEHIGISAARNLAFSKIETPFAASVDGDDYFDKDYLKHLMDAEEKYHADMVISNVVYVKENGEEKERFVFRPQAYAEKEAFDELLPALLEENRLNFLYAKLYKTELLRDVRIEPDVMQGSDTMINSMYLARVGSIAVIEDYDYHYVQYTKRSVTSYSGSAFFDRLYRINRFVMDQMEKNGFLNDEMMRVLDNRILYAGAAYLSRIGLSDDTTKNKYRLACEVINSEAYSDSYKRQKEKGNLEDFRTRYGRDAIAPGTEKDCIDRIIRIRKEEKKNRRLKAVRERCPDPVFRIWHGVKARLGIARSK